MRKSVCGDPGVDETHEQDLAHHSSIQRAVEQRIFPMQNRPLQDPLRDVVIERNSGFAQKQRRAAQNFCRVPVGTIWQCRSESPFRPAVRSLPSAESVSLRAANPR
jgi:hypothetical protein